MFFRITLCRIKIIAGHWRNMLLLFVLPVLLVAVPGEVIHTVLDPSGLPVALVDLDNSDYSRLVLERVAANPLVQAFTSGEESALRQVVTGRVEAAIILEPGFMDNIITGRLNGIVRIARAPSSISAGVLGEVAAAEVIRLAGNVKAADIVLAHSGRYHGAPPVDGEQIWREAWAFSDAQWEPPALLSLHYRDTGAGEDNETVTVSSGFRGPVEKLLILLGILTAVIMFLMIFLNGWLVEEKTSGLAARLRTTAVKPGLYLAGNSLAVIAVVLLSTLLSLAVTAAYIPPALVFSGPVLLLLLFYCGSCFTFALFLAAVSANPEQLQAAGIPIAAITSLLGGSFFNLAELNERFAIMARFTPQGWTLAGIRELLYTGAGWSAAWPSFVVLFCVFLFFLILVGRWDRL